jgi:two-component system sensor histidine kinase PhoQ
MLVILLFLPLAGLVLEQAYNNSLDKRLQEQLKIQTYSLMGLADEIEPGELWLPESLPDERFNQIGSGRYAQVTDSQGNPLWLSQSSLNIQLPNPIPNVLGELNIEDINPPGQFIFEQVSLETGLLIETVRVTVIWEGPQESENIYTFVVAESLKPYLAEKQTFRDTLLFWLGGLGVFLLLVNAVALFWALRPLKKLADEIHQVEKGDIQILQTEYPTELNEVAKNLNVLITHEQKQRVRYRNTLQDLAHSLKTPLSVIQASLTNIDNTQIKSILAEHVSRMNNIVSYQLQRAVSAGTSPIKQKVNVSTSVEKIFEALGKVYRDKNIIFQNDVAQSCVFFGDENDLLEVLGNLADNACKHGHSIVTVKSNTELPSYLESSETPKKVINLMIIDDGKGIPDALKKIIFQRGNRLDENNEGQGIGLSVVSDIVASYKGTIDITTDEQQQNVIRVILPGLI